MSLVKCLSVAQSEDNSGGFVHLSHSRPLLVAQRRSFNSLEVSSEKRGGDKGYFL